MCAVCVCVCVCTSISLAFSAPAGCTEKRRGLGRLIRAVRLTRGCHTVATTAPPPRPVVVAVIPRLSRRDRSRARPYTPRRGALPPPPEGSRTGRPVERARRRAAPYGLENNPLDKCPVGQQQRFISNNNNNNHKYIYVIVLSP